MVYTAGTKVYLYRNDPDKTLMETAVVRIVCPVVWGDGDLGRLLPN